MLYLEFLANAPKRYDSDDWRKTRILFLHRFKSKDTDTHGVFLRSRESLIVRNEERGFPYRDRGREAPSQERKTPVWWETASYLKRLEEAVSDLHKAPDIGLTRYANPIAGE